MTIWHTKASQNSQCMKGLFSPVDGFQIAGLGKTLPGPTFDGEVALGCQRRLKDLQLRTRTEPP